MTDLEPVLIADSLRKLIAGRTIVDSVSFEVRRGEVYGFLGPNGAGKTTTIRMLVGLIAPTSGSVKICGYDVQRHFEKAMRHIGCIVETPDLYRFMSGRENLEHFARMTHGVTPERIEEVARIVALDQRLDDRVGTYSLGMRQRLGIAQALLGKPTLLILDEPANGLDPAGIREIRHLLRRLASETGMAVFVSSHLLGEIELLCDRVAIIHRGRIITTGTVEELIAPKGEMELRVSDPEAALTIARDMGFTAHQGERTDESVVWLPIDEDETARFIAELSVRGISVFRAGKRSHSLEEMFLEATANETVVGRD